ncbi:hypothetical protein ID866_8361 [Astraeus odoratus]|nr:hypothetical protein ID866_8361 [Astraeus odoratus]
MHTHYDIIIGHSLGGAIIANLLPRLRQSQALSVVLVDPALEVSSEHATMFREIFAAEVADVRPMQVHIEENPKWARVDAITRTVGLHMCTSPEVVLQTFEVGILRRPWYQTCW